MLVKMWCQVHFFLISLHTMKNKAYTMSLKEIAFLQLVLKRYAIDMKTDARLIFVLHDERPHCFKKCANFTVMGSEKI